MALELRNQFDEIYCSGGGGVRDLDNPVNACVLTVGPVAMNWMSIAIDAYAVQLMINDRILFACPNLVSEGIYWVIGSYI